jgi:hypothetical protein
MTAIKFDLAPVTDADKKQGNISGLIDNFSFNQLPNELRFSPMGGIPPVLRAGVIRVALAKLSITGVLAALVSLHTTDDRAAFSCALAAAVNFVACAHYWHILKIRRQDMPSAFLSFASGRNKAGEWVGREETTNEDEKMEIQEFMVDGLRYAANSTPMPYTLLSKPSQ